VHPLHGFLQGLLAMETPTRKRKTCDELRDSLRKIGRKVAGNKSELESRLEEVHIANDRGWINRGVSVMGSYEYLASGAQRHVYKGMYEKGPRKNQYGVKKTFKSGSVYADSFFEEDIHATGVAATYIKAFNELQLGKKVYLNKPDVWQDVKPDGAGKKSQFIVEPFIEGSYRKFNSNTGFAADSFHMMQALSHYSYHCSGGKRLLCDLQGGYYADHYILTDPVICSGDQQFGVTDLGSAGIQNFFHYHRCNHRCNAGWLKPAMAARHFNAVPGTTFFRR